MASLKIEQGEWVVVCDGAKALVLENVGDRMFPNLKTREVYEHDKSPTREQGTDQPGRAFASVGEKRSAVEQTDWHAEAERAFLTDLAGRLDAAVTAGETKSLVMVAPPRALGTLRQVYSAGLRKALRAEVDKDYVKMPVHEIEKHLTGA
ncbi:MAG: host attachment protein [Xanthobacteraceae bacterium]|nr:host attachment protein [Xanthobacteraceae bacterium]PWB66055.1 MAG: host attachment protein [Bradyrhizobiaceae bacterium]